MNWLKKNFVIIILLVFGIIAGVAGFTYIGDLLKPHQQVEEEVEPEVELPSLPITEEVSEEDENWLELPRKRNLVVVIDNDLNARPQSGLNEADLVFELPIEGGTTRFMAVFSRYEPELIGPIRSARDYNIDISKEYDPIFVHAGGSPQAFAKFGEIGNLNGLEGGVDRAFWRINEREAPYNLYSDANTLRRVALQEGFRENGQIFDFKYLSSKEEFKGNISNKISISYQHSDFRAEYLYDDNTKRYLRFTGGVTHWLNTGEQLTAKNVIIQMINARVIDDEGRLELTLNGTGKAVFFSEGQVIQGIWEKKAGVTKYYQSEGEEVALKEGNTWISVVPVNVNVAY
ncbi:MAG: hypothetical protein VR72_03270 [Clostridiaceae bacterium BRH_c20a]|nr:MAG: hypothetical protein VR72_03270 [Clostridiaceae bacterium BRH_c20a]